MSSDFVAHYDTFGYFTNDKCFILVGQSLEYLTLFLNSQVNNFYFKTCLGAELGASGYEMRKIFVTDIPIPRPTDSQNKKASAILHDSQDLRSCIERANRLIYEAYNFTNEELQIIKSRA